MNGIIDKKFILTDEYKPLYELGRVRGPSHGPLVDPVQVSLLTLRKLILQRDNPSTIYEVVQLGITPNYEPVFSQRVTLDINNYDQSWYSIAGEPEPLPDAAPPERTIIYADGRKVIINDDVRYILINCEGGHFPTGYVEKGNIGDSEVDMTNRADGKMLVYDANTGKHIYVEVPIAGDGSFIEKGKIGDSEVDMTNREDGKMLVYHAATNKHIYVTVPSGNGSSYIHPENHPASMITGLSTVAISGKYSDLSGTPTIPSSLADLTDGSGVLKTVPVASETVIGGIKASLKTSEDTVEVKIDETTNRLYVKPETFIEEGKIGDSLVDQSNRSDGKMLVYNQASGKHVYTTVPSGGGSLPNTYVESINGASGVVTLSIPTKTTQLENDSKFLQSVPLATDVLVGGIKALEKTSEYTSEVRIDPSTGKLYVIPSSGGVGGGEGNLSMVQVSKMGVIASTAEPKIITIETNTTDFNVPQLNILKFDNTNTENKMVIKADFTNGESNDFTVDKYVVFDGKAHLKTEYLHNMTKTETELFEEWSVDVDVSTFKTVASISTNLDTNTLTVSAIPPDRILVPTGDINISNVQHLDYFNVAATGTNVRVVCSTDSGVSWKSFRNNQWISMDLTVSSMKSNGMTIAEINSINEYGWSMLNHGDKIRFAYLLAMDSISSTEEIDKLTIQYDSVGKWVQLKESDYDVHYEGNRTLIVTLKVGGDIKINY